MDDSLEYSDLSHLSIMSNGLSIKEETIENLLRVLPYQFELVFNRRTISPGGINTVTYEVHTRLSSTF